MTLASLRVTLLDDAPPETHGDPFLDGLIEAMTKPIPVAGSTVLVDGVIGTVVEIRIPATCTTVYVVDHGHGPHTYTVNDWNPHRPIVEVVDA